MLIGDVVPGVETPGYFQRVPSGRRLWCVRPGAQRAGVSLWFPAVVGGRIVCLDASSGSRSDGVTVAVGFSPRSGHHAAASRSDACQPIPSDFLLNRRSATKPSRPAIRGLKSTATFNASLREARRPLHAIHRKQRRTLFVPTTMLRPGTVALRYGIAPESERLRVWVRWR